MLIKCFGAAPQGINAVIVTIEVHAVPGYDFTLVGLPDNAVKESHERILAAILVNGFGKPRHSLTINMAPADIKKEGAAYDLPLAIGMLAAGEEVKTSLLEKFLILLQNSSFESSLSNLLYASVRMSAPYLLDTHSSASSARLDRMISKGASSVILNAELRILATHPLKRS